MDELLSFELSNAEFNPWIVPTQPEGRLAKFVHNEIDGENFGETLGNLADTVWDVLENRGSSKLLSYEADVYEEPVWITAEQFADYIQVDRSDAFNYLSVYFNVKDDNHPPLYFMALHTVSSLFQGRADAWMGCLVNLIALTAVMVLLIRIGRLLAESFGFPEYARVTGILCAMLYGSSAGAISTALLIRMYGLVTLWCVAYFYLIMRKWTHREFERRNFGLILVTMLGFWTQYFFLFYCIILALTVSVLLLRDRRVRELGCFVRSMAIAAAVGVAAFPFAISDVFSSGRGVEALNSLSEGFSGYSVRLWAFMRILGGRTFFPFFWVLLGLMVLLVMKNGRTGKGNSEKNGGKAPFVWMLILPSTGYFLLAARMSPYLVDRYIMPVFPFVILIGILSMVAVFAALKGRYGLTWQGRFIEVICAVALLAQMAGIFLYDGSYLYQGYSLQEYIAAKYSDYPCICIYDGVGYYENLPEFTHYKKTLLLTFDQLENRIDRSSIQELDTVAVLVKDSSAYELIQVTDILTEQYGFSVESYGWRGAGVHGDWLIIMGKDV